MLLEENGICTHETKLWHYRALIKRIHCNFIIRALLLHRIIQRVPWSDLKPRCAEAQLRNIVDRPNLWFSCIHFINLSTFTTWPFHVPREVPKKTATFWAERTEQILGCFGCHELCQNVFVILPISLFVLCELHTPDIVITLIMIKAPPRATSGPVIILRVPLLLLHIRRKRFLKRLIDLHLLHFPKARPILRRLRKVPRTKRLWRHPRFLLRCRSVCGREFALVLQSRFCLRWMLGGSSGQALSLILTWRRLQVLCACHQLSLLSHCTEIRHVHGVVLKPLLGVWLLLHRLADRIRIITRITRSTERGAPRHVEGSHNLHLCFKWCYTLTCVCQLVMLLLPFNLYFLKQFLPFLVLLYALFMLTDHVAEANLVRWVDVLVLKHYLELKGGFVGFRSWGGIAILHWHQLSLLIKPKRNGNLHLFRPAQFLLNKVLAVQLAQTDDDWLVLI